MAANSELFRQAIPSASGMKRLIEPRVNEWVNLIDGWLLLNTGEAERPARVRTRDDCRSFCARDDVEPLVTEFVQTWGRVVTVPNSARPVQVCVIAHTHAHARTQTHTHTHTHAHTHKTRSDTFDRFPFCVSSLLSLVAGPP